MATGRLGQVKKAMATKVYRILKRRKVPVRVCKASANRAGQVTKLNKRRRTRSRTRRRRSYRRMKY